jgi:hypothetical protein
MNEGWSVCESIMSIAQSVIQDPMNVNLKLKLTEKYLESLSEIYTKSKILQIPKGASELTNAIAVGAHLLGTWSPDSSSSHSASTQDL